MYVNTFSVRTASKSRLPEKRAEYLDQGTVPVVFKEWERTRNYSKQKLGIYVPVLCRLGVNERDRTGTAGYSRGY